MCGLLAIIDHNLPHAAWWRQERLPAWAEESLAEDALLATGYFSINTVNALRQQHQDGKGNYSRLLTGVLTTQLWHDAFDVSYE